MWEPVHSIADWYDGPRAGATEYEGKLYWYRSICLDSEDWNPDENRYELSPITSEFLNWELESHEIFARWDAARKAGDVAWESGDEHSFGALPEELPRYRELNKKIETFLTQTRPQHLLRGTFDLASRLVQWRKD